MNKVLNFVLPAIGVVLIIAVIGGYMYLTALPAADKENMAVLSDKAYLRENRQKYADCYYTTKSNPEFITPTVLNRFFNQGAPKDKLTTLEAEFLKKYADDCRPVTTSYENRFKQLGKDQLTLASAKQTEFDKLVKKSLEVEKQSSDIFSLYEMYDPKTLQYPTYDKAKMLYTADQFADYLNANL